MGSLLVIDDRNDVEEHFREIFAEHEVTWVDRYEGTEYLNAGAHDVVLCDWDLGYNTPSYYNGGAIVRELQSVYPTTKYVIWSGLEREGLPEGVEFFLKSDVPEIINRLSELLEGE